MKRRGYTMLKKLLIVMFLAVQFAAVANVAAPRVPLPPCFPCPVR